MANDLFVTTDPRGRTVYLTERCYQLHILIEHPDVADISEIEQTVEMPDFIAQDAIDEHRLVYYRTYQRNPQRWMIKVVVDGEEVVTAYRVKRIKEGEIILWQR